MHELFQKQLLCTFPFSSDTFEKSKKSAHCNVNGKTEHEKADKSYYGNWNLSLTELRLTPKGTMSLFLRLASESQDSQRVVWDMYFIHCETCCNIHILYCQVKIKLLHNKMRNHDTKDDSYVLCEF